MAFKSGANCKVTLGSTTILGVGNWNLSGITVDQYETSAFGDTWKQFISGLKDGGQITFSGVYDPADSTGQDQMRTYAHDQTQLTSIRLYVDNTSYYTPTTTNPLSYVTVSNYSITADKGDAVKTYARIRKEIGPEVDVFFGLRPGNWYDKMPNLIWAHFTFAGISKFPDLGRKCGELGFHRMPVRQFCGRRLNRRAGSCP